MLQFVVPRPPSLSGLPRLSDIFFSLRIQNLTLKTSYDTEKMSDSLGASPGSVAHSLRAELLANERARHELNWKLHFRNRIQVSKQSFEHPVMSSFSRSPFASLLPQRGRAAHVLATTAPKRLSGVRANLRFFWSLT